MRYRKDDVTFHAEAWQEGHAAVNVKVDDGWSELRRTIEQLLPEFGYAVDDVDALTDAIAEFDGIDDCASADGWEQAQDLAEETFGPGTRVWSEGRSGGWLVVADGHRTRFDEDEVAGWDAIALGRWARFERQVRAIADDQTYRVAWAYLANMVDVQPALAETGVGL